MFTVIIPIFSQFHALPTLLTLNGKQTKVTSECILHFPRSKTIKGFSMVDPNRIMTSRKAAGREIVFCSGNTILQQ